MNNICLAFTVLGIDVVGHPHDKLEWEVPPQEGSGSNNRLRCIPDRMGCDMSEP